MTDPCPKCKGYHNGPCEFDTTVFPRQVEYRESPKDAEIERLRARVEQLEAECSRLRAGLQYELRSWERKARLMAGPSLRLHEDRIALIRAALEGE